MPVQVKICGITNLADAERAIDGGAWAIGLIFHDPSPRSCPEPEAIAIASALKRRVEVCGVFVNPTLDEVVATADRVGLTMLQLHGDEGPTFCEAAARRTGCRVSKAIPVRSRADLQHLATYHTDFHHLDTPAKAVRGGTGRTFDWDLVRGRTSDIPLILSGGLNPENVAAGIAATAPWAVDTASGTEAEPGRKDPDKLDAFFRAVRNGATR